MKWVSAFTTLRPVLISKHTLIYQLLLPQLWEQEDDRVSLWQEASVYTLALTGLRDRGGERRSFGRPEIQRPVPYQCLIQRLGTVSQVPSLGPDVQLWAESPEH